MNEGAEVLSPLEVSDGDKEFQAYLFLLSQMFRSRDDLDEAAWWAWAQGKSLISPNHMTHSTLDLSTRRTLVALTWPLPFEKPAAWADLYRVTSDPRQLGRSVGVNVATISWRWWHSFVPGAQPKVEGAHLELGQALEMLAPGYGVAPSAIRRLLAGKPALLALDEVVDLATSIYLTYGAERPYVDGQGAWPLPTFEDLLEGRRLANDLNLGHARWWVSDQQLAADLLLEGKLLRHRRELAEQIVQQQPLKVHEKRVAPFGPPPTPRSRYYPLFAWLDGRQEGQFRVPIDTLAEIFEGKHPDLQAIPAPPTNPRPLPGSARTTPGWWSNPRGASATKPGVGSQRQRIAWVSAGYKAKPLIDRDPLTNAPSVVNVEFQAIPGREQWHPFRDRFRHAETGLPALADGVGASDATVEFLQSHGAEVLRWFDRTEAVWGEAQKQAVWDEAQQEANTPTEAEDD